MEVLGPVDHPFSIPLVRKKLWIDQKPPPHLLLLVGRKAVCAAGDIPHQFQGQKSKVKLIRSKIMHILGTGRPAIVSTFRGRRDIMAAALQAAQLVISNTGVSV